MEDADRGLSPQQAREIYFVTWVAACQVAELEDGVPLIRTVRSREMVLTRWRDEVFACRNVCPHHNASFAHGDVHLPIVGRSPREVTRSNTQPVLTCPWHLYEFDLRTGRCLGDPFFRVRAYEVLIDDATVYVELKER